MSTIQKANNSINIELLNYAGASVLKLNQPLEEGKNNITLPMSELDNGVYILKVVSEKSGKTTHHKIIKN
ncbi:MAG: T9SS type A sorting domain-containing protein [Bacteroidetes bacterium]|nr:T9SS type A sorting domain-containing protein [Bacteroidota bacterium]